MNSLLPFLNDLEKEAEVKLCGKMDAFDPGGIRCPWLEWRKRREIKGGRFPPLHGLLLMQDWGNVGERLDDAVTTIQAAVDAPKPLENDGDDTLRNLLSESGWKSAIKNGDWIVSNAVWGIRREGQKKSGPIDNCHIAAFPIWLKLVECLSQNNDDFKLVVAGGWAIFGSQFRDAESIKVQKYFERWIKWVCQKDPQQSRTDLDRLAANCRGVVFRMRHPGSWSWPDKLQKGPPI